MDARDTPASPEPTPPVVAWLFPTSYAIHVAEEYFVAGGFAAWAERTIGIDLTTAEFLVWNASGLALMCSGAALVASHPKFRFIEIAMAMAVLGNGAAHAIASLITTTYSPGLGSAVLLWLPFGTIRFRAAYRLCSRRARRAGLYLGFSVLVVMLAVLALARADGARRDAAHHAPVRAAEERPA